MEIDEAFENIPPCKYVAEDTEYDFMSDAVCSRIKKVTFYCRGKCRFYEPELKANQTNAVIDK